MTNREWAEKAFKVFVETQYHLDPYSPIEAVFAEYEKQIRTNERNILNELWDKEYWDC